MRIISGKYKGHRLAAISAGIRPSSNRLRKTLFDVLGDFVDGSVWLEPFAGSGAIGLEALSRYASYVIWNDKNSEAISLIRKNASICRIQRDYEIHRMPVFTFLKKLQVKRLDCVFLDPPYDFGKYQKLLKIVSLLPGVLSSTKIILEASKRKKFRISKSGLTVIRSLNVGDSQLMFFSIENAST